MADINNVNLIGRLTRDAELKCLANGTAVAKFSIAVNRRRRNGDQWEDEASFFDIVLWGRQAESLNQHLFKGRQIAISGELKQERWQQDGQNRSKVEVVANTIQLLGGGNSNGDSGSGNSGEQRQGEHGRGKQPAQSYTAPPSEDGFADDIPF